MPLFKAGRPLKRWRYVGVFDEQLMACAALVRVGPARQSFWAVLARGRPLRERTRRLPRDRLLRLTPGICREGMDCCLGEASRVRAGAHERPGRLLLHDGGVTLDLRLDEDAGIEALCAHGRGLVWTRKQAGIPARGAFALDDGDALQLDARAVIDDTAGYHARHTEWWWSAGVGESPEGVPLAWNLVAGVNDPPRGSERAVWVDGRPSEAPPVRFTADLGQIACEDGSLLRFSAAAERSHRENLLVVRSDYRAPFGSFEGTLPGGTALLHGLGVVEHHRAVW